MNEKEQSFNSTMVQSNPCYIKRSKITFTSFNSTMVQSNPKEGSVWSCLKCGFQFHDGSIKPLLFSQHHHLILLVSIPRWFNQTFHQLFNHFIVNPVSIPRWFNQTIGETGNAYQHTLFQFHDGSIKPS